MIRISTILLPLLWLHAQHACASGFPVTELHNDPQWLALLEMRKTNTASGYKSEVDQSSFFLSGRTDDPAQEMIATTRQFNADPSTWCRFPARGTWLLRHELIKQKPVTSCPELEQWRSAIPTKRLVLVFPSVYLNSASSMFGHTFLRFEDTGSSISSPLLSKSVSYYADMSEQVNSFDYIFKGIFGGFKGTLDVMPYYEMIRKYNANEDRDIWEYTLSYSSDDIKLLIDHLWEVRGHSFDYYFFDENCSYRILAFLDTITPNHDMRHQFKYYVTPINTIRALKKRDKVANVSYIPSSTKIIRKALGELPPDSIQKIESFIKKGDGLSKNELNIAEANIAIQVISLSIHQDGTTTEKENNRRLLFDKLLSAPAQSTTEQKIYVKQPAISPEDGHLNRKFEIDYGHDNETNNFIDFLWQETYHDFFDPASGYERGVSLTGPALTMRYSEEKDWKIQKANLLSITSLNPVNPLDTPLSWKLDINRKRMLINSESGLSNNIDLYLGLTYEDQKNIYWFGMAGAGMTHSGLLNGDTSPTAITKIGFIYQSPDWTAYVDLNKKMFLIDDNNPTTDVTTSLTKSINQNTSFRIEYNKFISGNQQHSSVLLGISKYY